MKGRNGELKFRNLVTLGAEIAAILSLLLNWLMYQNTRNIEEQPKGVNTLVAISLAVNVVLLIFFTVILIRMLIVNLKGKKHSLENKFNSYVSSEPQYLRVKTSEEKDSLLSKTKEAIKQIDESKAFDQDVYYMILYSLFHTAEGNINVVSILDDNEWVYTPEEDEFLRVNLSVSERRVHLNRIFVVNEADVKDKLNNNSINSFIEADHTYIHLFVVFRERLTRSLTNDIGSGYIDFDRYAVACDVFSDNEIRGTLKFDPKEVDRYYKNFMRLSEYYIPLNQEFKDKYLK
ncbi:hypothetical protein AALA36_13675 [Lachnospiraceae bacterium 66-29]